MKSEANANGGAKRSETCRRIARPTDTQEPCTAAQAAPDIASAGKAGGQGQTGALLDAERWWATQYRDGQRQTCRGTRGEVEAAAGGKWGFVLDAAYGNNVIQRPEGDVITHPDGLPEVSDSAAVMLFLLMSFPGRWHDPFTISRQPLCWHLLKNGNCPQCAKRLRRVFGEGGKPGYHEMIRPFYFILTRKYPYALRWNAEATYIVLEPEAQLRGARHPWGRVFPSFHLTYWRVRGLPIPSSISGHCDSETA